MNIIEALERKLHDSATTEGEKRGILRKLEKLKRERTAAYAQQSADLHSDEHFSEKAAYQAATEAGEHARARNSTAHIAAKAPAAATNAEVRDLPPWLKRLVWIVLLALFVWLTIEVVPILLLFVNRGVL
ncbi:hypothetical protein [Sulfitobacter sp.]|uniref:hypothetical protein n=1 Tax=Sulfitobacter sp. TaxID=1903071 RepID=UPI003001286B